jgi:hypothetical protein
MSEENVEAFKRAIEAANRQDEIAWLVRYRDDLAVWGHAYQSHAEALEAAGLRE